MFEEVEEFEGLRKREVVNLQEFIEWSFKHSVTKMIRELFPDGYKGEFTCPCLLGVVCQGHPFEGRIRVVQLCPLASLRIESDADVVSFEL